MKRINNILLGTAGFVTGVVIGLIVLFVVGLILTSALGIS